MEEVSLDVENNALLILCECHIQYSRISSRRIGHLWSPDFSSTEAAAASWRPE